MYNLLAQPQTLAKLRAELADKPLTRPFPKFSEVRDLPYLDACINEGARLHPPFCLPFERVVPAGGVQVLGQTFPEGTVIGMSPWVVNRHRPTFGEDADEWNPDRFMVDEPLRKTRENAILTVS
jgi:cytochrome P450